MIEITGANAPEAFNEMLWKLSVTGYIDDSRNGKVNAFPSPVFVTIKNPWERVIFSPTRDCNPFFHVMETVWMFAGSNDAEWIGMFNSRMEMFADDGYLRGAYGWRWRNNGSDQIHSVIQLLREDPKTRQAVISMWDPIYDGPKARTSDRPCNTHIYFRTRQGPYETHLDMTVCNRSNDVFWGMFGSNVVHMTYLHELIARATGYDIGRYQVFSNNAHAYIGMAGYDDLMKDRREYDYYHDRNLMTYPLLQPYEKYEELLTDCMTIYDGPLLDSSFLQTQWARNIAYPMYHAYLDKPRRDYWISQIVADDWKVAAQEWWERRKSK